MSTENKPSDKIELATTELKIGGVNLKGAWILWFFAAVSAVGGGIYAAGQVWGEYQGLVKRVDSIKMPDGEPVVKLIENVAAIEADLAELEKVSMGNAEVVAKVGLEVQSLRTLIDSNDVSKLQGAIATLKTSVDGVQVFTRDVQAMREKQVVIEKDLQALRTDMGKDLQVMKKDIDSTWNAIDTLGNNSLKGK